MEMIFKNVFIFGCAGSSGLFGLLSRCGLGLLTAVASLVAEHRLWGTGLQ